MNMIIRFKIVGGKEGEDLYTTEDEARAALAETLAEHVRRGHRVSNVGNESIIDDTNGDLVATYELMP